MSNVIKILKIILDLLPYLADILEFLNSIKRIEKESGTEVAAQIAKDAATIAHNWNQYLDSTRVTNQNVEQQN